MIAGMVGFLSPILASPITAGFVIFEATRQDFSSLLILIPLSVISYLSYQLINKFIKQLLIIKNNRQ
jgi:H+/Cl- antiporter ClcA